MRNEYAIDVVAEDMDDVRAALVVCPRCGVRPGETCNSLRATVRGRKLLGPHAARVSAGRKRYPLRKGRRPLAERRPRSPFDH